MMWEKQKEADNTADDPAKSAPAPNKRRWDQETPDEPFQKKKNIWQAINVKEKANEPSQNQISENVGVSSKMLKSSIPGELCDMKSAASKTLSGFSMGVKKTKLPPAPIKMTLGLQKQKEAPVTLPKTKLSAAAASAFNDEDESEEEEMPPEAKMRMRNIGRDTPTAAGPNSFGKGRLGFCDRQRMIQKEIEKEIQKLQDS